MAYYRLTKNFAGKSKGNVITTPTGSKGEIVSWEWEGATIILKTNSNLLERIGFVINSFISIKGIDKDHIYTDCQNSVNAMKAYLDIIKDKEVAIHSVKRLEDGKIFTLGDKIKWDFIHSTDKPVQIKSFSYRNDTIFINNLWNIDGLKNLKIHREPLFQSNENLIYIKTDCYDIYDGDEVYLVANNDTQFIQKFKAHKGLEEKFYIFKSLMSANYFIKLQTEIAASGLKQGDTLPDRIYKIREISHQSFSERRLINTAVKIARFAIVEGESVAVMFQGAKIEILPLSQFPIKNIMKFGNKDVEIVPQSFTTNIQIRIKGVCDTTYWELKQFVTSLQNVRSFKLGGKLRSNYFISEEKTIHLRFGDDVQPTLAQLEDILEECDRLLIEAQKKKN